MAFTPAEKAATRLTAAPARQAAGAGALRVPSPGTAAALPHTHPAAAVPGPCHTAGLELKHRDWGSWACRQQLRSARAGRLQDHA